MKKIKIIFSLLLIFVIIISNLTLVATAENLTTEEILITEVSAIVVEPVDGEKMSFSVTSSDPEKYSVELSYWKDTTTNQKWTEEHNKAFIGGHSYTPYVTFTPNEGYCFSYKYSEMTGYINGRSCVSSATSSYLCQFWLLDNEFDCAEIPDTRIALEEVRITISADVRGLSVKDYEKIVSVETPNAKIETNEFENIILISSENYLNECKEPDYNPYTREHTGALIGGKYYAIMFYIIGSEGYKITEDTKIYINDELINIYSGLYNDGVLLGTQIKVYTPIQSFIMSIMLKLQNFLNLIKSFLE